MPPKTFSGARTPHLSGTADGTLPFIGRTALLRLAASRLQADRGTVLTGPIGIGKSRTLRVIEDAAEREGRSVVRLLATRSGATVPYGVFLAHLPLDLVEQAARMDSLDRALLVRSGVLALGIEVLGVDDAHLLDEESAALVLDLASTGTVVVLVLDATADAPDAVLTVPDAAQAETVELPPFSAAESAELIEAVLQGPTDGGTTLALHEAAQGVPLVLRELLEALRRDGGVARTDGVWSLTERMRAPQAVQLRLLDRLRDLDDATRSWVELVAAAGQVPADLAASLADEDAIDRAELSGWVRLDEQLSAHRLEHPLDRDPVLHGLGTRARRRALRTLIDAATSAGRPLSEAEAAELGRWRLDAGEPLTRDEALRLAAATSPSDPELAERFLRRAATGGDALSLAALAQHLIASGGIKEAESLLDAADAAGGQAVRVAALRALAIGLGDRRSGQALQRLERAIADHPDEPDLLGVQIALYAAEGRAAEAIEVTRRLRALPDPGAGAVLGEVYGAMAMAVRGEQFAALRVAGDLRPLAEENVHLLPEGPMLQAWLEAAVPWTGAKDPVAACEIAQRGYDRTLRAGLRPDRARFAHLLAVGRLLQGDATLATRLLREAESAPCFWRDSRRPEIVANLVEAQVLSGEQAEAELTMRRLDELRLTPEQAPKRELARAALMAGRGDRTAAAETATAVGDAAADRGDLVAAADAWTDALRYGGGAAARRLVEQGDQPAGVVRDLVRRHAAAHLDHDVAALERVAEQYWTADVRLYAIEAIAAAARWALQSGDTVAANDATGRLLRWTVATPGLTDPLADASPFGGLTSREQEIARLAATGLQDHDIARQLGISKRTAETHLNRAFRKLGVHKRQELVRLLPPRAPGDPLGAPALTRA